MNFSAVMLVLMLSITILLENAQTVNSQFVPPQVIVPPQQVVVPPQQVIVPQPNPMNGCFWSGTSPFCFGKCGNFYNTVSVDRRGDGKTCLTGTKKLCCPRPNLLSG